MLIGVWVRGEIGWAQHAKKQKEANYKWVAQGTGKTSSDPNRVCMINRIPKVQLAGPSVSLHNLTQYGPSIPGQRLGPELNELSRETILCLMVRAQADKFSTKGCTENGWFHGPGLEYKACVMYPSLYPPELDKLQISSLLKLA